eukprot:TRINITY_DN19041_c0_g1_i3.p2 TRINITY_DN19041_c0_g1~~TRINITY_DN19041_c0_g1_i3.p2  ORF type:complete len:101 (-),score=12.17 TRINITY_DN19041_c0_g1_i3:310-612(-)
MSHSTSPSSPSIAASINLPTCAFPADDNPTAGGSGFVGERGRGLVGDLDHPIPAALAPALLPVNQLVPGSGLFDAAGLVLSGLEADGWLLLAFGSSSRPG